MNWSCFSSELALHRLLRKEESFPSSNSVLVTVPLFLSTFKLFMKLIASAGEAFPSISLAYVKIRNFFFFYHLSIPLCTYTFRVYQD